MTAPILQSLHADLEALDAVLTTVKNRISQRRQKAVLTLAAQAQQSAAIAQNDVETLTEKAAHLYRARRNREKTFAGLNLFGEPAWDILLDLFVAAGECRQISVSSATIAATVAPTTGLRWIQTLIDNALVERIPDPADRRRSFIQLTDGGYTLVADAVARS